MSLRRIVLGRDPGQDPDPVRNPGSGTRHREGHRALTSSPRPSPRETRKPTKPTRAPRPAKPSRPAATSAPRKSKVRSSQPILGRASSSRKPASRSIVGRGGSPLSGGKRISGRGGMPKGKKIR